MDGVAINNPLARAGRAPGGDSRLSSGDESVAISPLSVGGGGGPRSLASMRATSAKGGASPSDSEIPWHTLATAEEVYAAAGTTSSGLPEPEAQRRREIYGPNQMTVRGKRTMWQKIWDQVNSIIMYILLISATVSGAFQEWKEFALILIVVIVNVVIGAWQGGGRRGGAGAAGRAGERGV
jgi:hypothetical protein